MKKRISTRVLCLLIALAMLTGALMVSAINGSPYETLKNAAINAIFYDNVTIEAEFVLRVDGQVHERSWIQTQIGDEGTFSLESTESLNNWSIPGERMSFRNQDLMINEATVTEDGTMWFSARRHSGGWSSNSPGYYMFGNAGRNSNQLRFMELLADLVVGDLKNNFTIGSHGDNLRRVSGAITESQLPEIVRVLIDMAVEEQYRWRSQREYTRGDFNHVLEIPVRSLDINRITLSADIDNYGNLIYINGEALVTIENIFGDVHEIAAELTANFTDIGTTVSSGPFADAIELFTEAFFERYTSSAVRWSTIFFTLDENGNVNLESITEQRPNDPVSNRPTTTSILAPFPFVTTMQHSSMVQ